MIGWCTTKNLVCGRPTSRFCPARSAKQLQNALQRRMREFAFLRGDVAAFSGVINKAGALQRVYESAELKLASCMDNVGPTLQDKVLLALWQIAWSRYQHACRTFKDEHMSEECRKALSVLGCIERCQANSSLCTHEFDARDVVKSVKEALKHYHC
jgi:hypothetical protein